MKTYPTGVTITPIATYDNDNGDILTVSRRAGGIGQDDYLIAGAQGFSAHRKTLDKAIETALRELIRLQKEAEESETN